MTCRHALRNVSATTLSADDLLSAVTQLKSVFDNAATEYICRSKTTGTAFYSYSRLCLLVLQLICKYGLKSELITAVNVTGSPVCRLLSCLLLAVIAGPSRSAFQNELDVWKRPTYLLKFRHRIYFTTEMHSCKS